MQKFQIIFFLGCSVEKNSDCATNEMFSPGSTPTPNNSVYSSPAKKRFFNFMSPVKSESPPKSPLKTQLIGKYIFGLKIQFQPSSLNYITLKLQSSNLIQVIMPYSKYFLGVIITFKNF